MLVSLTILSAFLGGAATTLILNARPAPTLAQDAPKEAPKEAPKGADRPEGEITEEEMKKIVDEAVAAEEAKPYQAKKPVESDEFRLVDASGKLRGRFGFDSKGSPNLYLYDNNGKEYPQGENMAGKELLGVIETEAARLLKIEEHKDVEVELQHILIAFEGAARSQNPQSREDAAAKAWDLYQQVKGGADIAVLMKANSDDPGPGIYKLTTAATPAQGVYPRTQMIPCFGDLGWRLKVGEVGITNYHPQTGQFGYHIIKRLK